MLETQPGAQLHGARLVLFRPSNTAKSRTAWIGIGRSEARVVKEIVDLEAELQLDRLGKANILV